MKCYITVTINTAAGFMCKSLTCKPRTACGVAAGAPFFALSSFPVTFLLICLVTVTTVTNYTIYSINHFIINILTNVTAKSRHPIFHYYCYKLLHAVTNIIVTLNIINKKVLQIHFANNQLFITFCNSKDLVTALFNYSQKKTNMPAYSFKERFVPFILDGTKTQTVRSRRRHPAKPGDTLYLYSGLRTKYCKNWLSIHARAQPV